jgi:hypothetical protein
MHAWIGMSFMAMGGLDLFFRAFWVYEFFFRTSFVFSPLLLVHERLKRIGYTTKITWDGYNMTG